jgi:hypothetical protein
MDWRQRTYRIAAGTREFICCAAETLRCIPCQVCTLPHIGGRLTSFGQGARSPFAGKRAMCGLAHTKKRSILLCKVAITVSYVVEVVQYY